MADQYRRIIDMIDFALRPGNEESNLAYLQREIDELIKVLETIGCPIIPPMPENVTVETLKNYLFCLLAQKMALEDQQARNDILYKKNINSLNARFSDLEKE